MLGRRRQTASSSVAYQNPPPPFPLLIILICALWLCYLLLAKRRILMRDPHRLDQLWRCWPVTLCAYLTAQYDLQTVNISSQRDLSDPYRSLVFAMPIAGFGLLLLSEAVAWLFASLGPKRAFANLRHPVMAVHMVTFLYYSFEPGTESCVMYASRHANYPGFPCRHHFDGRRVPCPSVDNPAARPRVTRWDAFGRPLHPLRYVMWTISVSSMCLSLFLIVENILQQSKASRSLSREQLRDKFVNACADGRPQREPSRDHRPLHELFFSRLAPRVFANLSQAALLLRYLRARLPRVAALVYGHVHAQLWALLRLDCLLLHDAL